MDELRNANVPSAAFPGELLADVIPAEVITTLAVIEQTDDEDFLEKGRDAFDEVLSQYGLKREEAYRYSVSSAKALGPMQFTNRHGNGTYSLVVRRCSGAQIDPNFERGATRLQNAMKAAACLLDIELSQMNSDIRSAYRTNPEVLGIFAVAAYNGGPRNVAKLYRALDRMGVQLDELRRAGQLPRTPQSPAPVSGASKPRWCEQSAFRGTTAKIAATSKSIKASSACLIESASAEMAHMTIRRAQDTKRGK